MKTRINKIIKKARAFQKNIHKLKTNLKSLRVIKNQKNTISIKLDLEIECLKYKNDIYFEIKQRLVKKIKRLVTNDIKLKQILK